MILIGDKQGADSSDIIVELPTRTTFLVSYLLLLKLIYIYQACCFMIVQAMRKPHGWQHVEQRWNFVRNQKRHIGLKHVLSPCIRTMLALLIAQVAQFSLLWSIKCGPVFPNTIWLQWQNFLLTPHFERFNLVEEPFLEMRGLWIQEMKKKANSYT